MKNKKKQGEEQKVQVCVLCGDHEFGLIARIWVQLFHWTLHPTSFIDRSDPVVHPGEVTWSVSWSYSEMRSRVGTPISM